VVDLLRRFGAQDSFQMTLPLPPFLKSGDCIGIAATARWVSREQLQPAIDVFTGWGLRVKVADQVFTQEFQLAGTAESRCGGLQQMLDDPEVNAVIIARGGYGTVQLIDQLRLDALMRQPKWIAGYSDITVLHGHLNSRGFATIHSTMPISFPDATELAIEELRRCLFGEQLSFTSLLPYEGPSVTGRLVGGNLSVLYSIAGSDSWKFDEPLIVFLEDVDEMLYHVDRMLWGLERGGAFRHVKAIVCGGFTQMKDNTKAFNFPTDNPWGNEVEAIIRHAAKRLGVPVAFGFPAGHLSDNRAFYLGRKVTLEPSADGARMSYQQG
jgi:muramoyltetrapeptide carboxypeptidase